MRPAVGVLPHLLQRPGLGLVEHVVEQHQLALARVHIPVDPAEVHVDAAVRPRLAPSPRARGRTGEVQRLVPGHDVERAVEVEALAAVLGGREVARRVERAAVGLLEEHRRLALGVGQVDDERALGLLHPDGAGNLLDDRVHLVLVEALARRCARTGCRAARTWAGSPGATSRGARFHSARAPRGLPPPCFRKKSRASLVEGRVLLRADVGLDVDVHEVGHLAPARGIAVLREAHRHQAELLPPVAEVVDALHPPALAPVEVGDGVADEGGSQVVEGDGLGDVGRAVVDDHRLAARPRRSTRSRRPRPAPRRGGPP